MAETLTPDELGDAGEDLFRSLCTLARLDTNKSDRDKTGWDFRVEFSMNASGVGPLDKKLPRVCQIQVKSTAGESGPRVSASLSSIDRLAKDASPSAVVVMRLRRDGSPMMGYVIHLIDNALARVLHRLRRAEADARHDLNKLSVTFDYTKGRRFQLTPEGLREALEEVASADVAEYTARKAKQLANLGYEEGGGLEANALFQVDSVEHLGRVLSGLQPLRPVRLVAYDRRFGIRVPYQGTLLDDVEEFDLHLPSLGALDIVIKNGPLQPAALFQCEAFVPPPTDITPLLVIRHPLIDVLFKRDGMEIETRGTFDEARYDLDEWILLLRGLSYLASGTGTVEMQFRDIRIAPTRVPQNSMNGPNLDQLPDLLEFMERWQRALDIVGIAAPSAIAIRDVWDANDARMYLDMMFNHEPLARMEFDYIDGVGDTDHLDALYFNTCTFGGAGITFAVKAHLKRAIGSKAFASTTFNLLDVRPAVIDLQEYGADIAAENGLTIVIDPRNVIMPDQVRDGTDNV